MSNPKLGTSTTGEPMHYSVGALIKKNNRYLLIDRATDPQCIAGISGHIDEGESPEQALVREVFEESGLRVVKYKLLFKEERHNNTCNRWISIHYWYFYECETSGKINPNPREARSIKPYSPQDMQRVCRQGNLGEMTEYWFRKLRII
jgi:8-oxo-dGTP pyrophosphatase MutT (NUDIX family)